MEVEFEETLLNRFRERNRFAWLPLFVDNKFRWLKKVRVLEQRTRYRYRKFDDGWTYTSYWSKWHYEWKIIEILN